MEVNPMRGIKTLETERLLLRAWTKADAGDLFDYAKNPNVGPNGGWKPHETIEESMEIIDSLFLAEYYIFAIQWKATGKVIGAIGFEEDGKRPSICCLELGYALAEEFWGMGIMTEAARMAITYGFEELELDLISIYRNPKNTRSGRVIEKCGFKREGVLRKANKIYDGTLRDVACYSLKKEEYTRQLKEKNFTYLLKCADDTYYCGWTTDLESRIKAHNSGLGAKYTKGRTPVELCYYEAFKTKGEAMKREVQIKKLSKEKKEGLILEKKLSKQE